MISSALRNWQQSRNYRIDGDTVYGVANGVGFSVAEEDGGKLCIFMLSAQDSGFDALEDMFMAERGGLSDIQVGDVENYLALFYDESEGRMSDGLLDELLEYVAANARSCGFRPPNKCVKCGGPANKRSFYNGMVQPMCAECRAEQQQPRRAAQPQQSRQRGDYGDEPLTPKKSSYDENYDEYADIQRKPQSRPQSQGRMQMDDEMMGERTRASAAPKFRDEPSEPENTPGMSFVGALLGALAGLVPFFVSMVADFPLAALCCVSGIGAVLGYIAFSGVRDKSSSLGMILASSEILSIIGVVVAYVLTSAKSAGSFEAASATMWSSPTALIVNIVLAALGVLLGFAVVSTKLSRYISDN